MQTLEANEKYLWYALQTGTKTPITDSNGFKTGENEHDYGEPVKVRMSMATSSGANNLGSQGIAELEVFGIDTGYTARAVTYDMACPIDETSHIWYGIDPTRVVRTELTVNGETTTVEETVAVQYNYVVVRRSVSINHITYYLKEVDVD